MTSSQLLTLAHTDMGAIIGMAMAAVAIGFVAGMQFVRLRQRRNDDHKA